MFLLKEELQIKDKGKLVPRPKLGVRSVGRTDMTTSPNFLSSMGILISIGMDAPPARAFGARGSSATQGGYSKYTYMTGGLTELHIANPKKYTSLKF